MTTTWPAKLEWEIRHRGRPELDVKLTRDVELPFLPWPGLFLTFEATAGLRVELVGFDVPTGQFSVSGYTDWGSDADALAARDRRIAQWAGYGWQRAPGR